MISAGSAEWPQQEALSVERGEIGVQLRALSVERGAIRVRRGTLSIERGAIHDAA